MSKGITPIIFAILMVLLIVAMSVSFFQWSKGVSQAFENTTKGKTESEIEKTQTSFTIVNVVDADIGIKNNGRVFITLGDFSFFLNNTMTSYTLTPPSVLTDELSPGDVHIFTMDLTPVIFPAGTHNYTIRVTGPYGIADEVFDELDK